MKHFLTLLFLITGSISLYGSSDDLSLSKGTDQDVIAQLTPVPAQTDVWNNAKIEVSFTVPLDASRVQKNNIKLTHLSSKTNEHIDGAISYDKYDNKVLYAPNALLVEGIYEVEIKSLKADKAYKTTQIKEIKYRFYVPEVINGHQLPPEPDPVVTDSTLLGLDANENGVRDDVEIWILRKYKDKHPIYIDIAMQIGRAWQKILEDPSKARETSKLLHAAQNCESYFQYYAKWHDDPILITEPIMNRAYRQKVTNTQGRETVYWQYDNALSGSIVVPSQQNTVEDFCDFNVTKYLKSK
ncbi:MAG: Ig-like domain-containing protein [Thiovulaceae bacterium]|nr:Ig-like domain-containing protein [Sulfurimonadaceae bacterium]